MKGFVELNKAEIEDLNSLSAQGYQFDWTKRSSATAKTIAFLTNGDIAGLVEFERQPENRLNYMWLIEVATDYKGTGVAGKLLAIVGKDSIEANFEGFVVFEPKTVLYEYYIKKYRAKPISGRKLYFDTEATTWLIREYLEKETE
jgi:hypothetical protein